jgi:hypothetical protein
MSDYYVTGIEKKREEGEIYQDMVIPLRDNEDESTHATVGISSDAEVGMVYGRWTLMWNELYENHFNYYCMYKLYS